jgi:hypothetical protein
MKNLYYILFIFTLFAYANNNVLPYCTGLGKEIFMSDNSENKEEKTDRESEKDIDFKEKQYENICLQLTPQTYYHVFFFLPNSYFTYHSFPLSLKSIHDKEIPSPPPDTITVTIIA